MAHHKDAIKRIRQNRRRRLRNRHYRTRMRNEIKKLRKALEAGDLEAAKAQFPKATSTIQRVAQKGVIHRRQAARRVARLARALNAALAAAETREG